MKTVKSETNKNPNFHRGSSLKSSIQKRLGIRLLVAGTLISIALAATVFFIEFQRLGRLVNNRASQIAARFNDDIRHLMDDPNLSDKTVLRNKLKMLSIIGKLDVGMGYLIYAGIYDLAGGMVVMEKDAQCSYILEVEEVMDKEAESLSATLKQMYRPRFINKMLHIQLAFPLSNSRGEPTAILSGIFAVSPETADEVVNRIIRTTFESIGIVLLTTFILYPTIITLIKRLTGLADTLLEANIETLQVLGSAIAKRDSETDIHNYRVTIYSVILAEACGVGNKQIRALIKGAFLHDIGKIGISDKILLKPGKLTESERETMKGHVNHGIDIVERSDWLKDAIDVVGYHHEQFTGKGYPYGLKGDLIPINARIFAIADIFDALTSSRPYKDAMPFDEAMAILSEGRGTHFDPSLFDIFNTIAKTLYDKVANSSYEALREKLESKTRQYFSKRMYSS